MRLPYDCKDEPSVDIRLFLSTLNFLVPLLEFIMDSLIGITESFVRFLGPNGFFVRTKSFSGTENFTSSVSEWITFYKCPVSIYFSRVLREIVHPSHFYRNMLTEWYIINKFAIK